MTQQENVGKKIRSRFPHVDIILGTSNLHLLGEKIDELKTKESIVEISQDFLISDNVPLFRTSGVNAWVNIIYGCNNFCTYCIVPYVRGKGKKQKKRRNTERMPGIDRRRLQRNNFTRTKRKFLR